MNEQPDVTVIIPAYNCSETIERAIASIALQTVKPNQVIIVDDYSTDTTTSILDMILTKRLPFNLVVLHNRENLGPGLSRNLGWNTATTKWIAFLDADDAWHPRKLELQLDVISEFPTLDLVCTNSYFIEQGSSIPNIVDNCVITSLNFNQMLFRNLVKTRSVLMRREILKRFEKGLSEDYGLWLACLYSGMSFARLECPLTFHYRKEYSGGGLSSRVFTHEYFELRNLSRYALDKPILVFCASIFSVVKFTRRLLIVLLRKALS